MTTNILRTQREYVMSVNNTAQQKLNSILETLNKQTNVIQIKEPLHGDIDLSDLREFGFGNIETLEFVEGEITTILGLPPTLKKLVCPKNLLFFIDDLPPALVHLDLAQNHIETIDLLELNALEVLNLSSNKVTKLDHLPPTLLELHVQDNRLTFLDLQGLTQLKTLNVSENKITVIENLPETVVTLLVENNPAIEFRHAPAVPKPTDSDTHYEEHAQKMTYQSALQEYFKLKQKYEEKTSKMKHAAYDRAKTKRDKKEAVLAVKPQCVKCGRAVGTIFAKKNNRFTAICGDTRNPCKLDIQIFTGEYNPISYALHEMKDEVENFKESIIRQKLDTLFNYAGENESIEKFKKEMEGLNRVNVIYKELNDVYTDLYHSRDKKDLMDRKESTIFVCIERIRVLLAQYKKDENAEVLKTTMQMQVEELFPEVRNLRMLQNEVMEMEEGCLIKHPVSLAKSEHTFNEPPRVIKFVK
jgi:hypothetical protein